MILNLQMIVFMFWDRFKKRFYRKALTFPLLRRWSSTWYRLLGIHDLTTHDGFRISNPTIIGDYSNLYLHDNAEINAGCFLLAKDRIEIGENSTLAYGASIITSSNPNGPKNKLAIIYPKYTAPVVLKKNVWVGANATILPGVTIGECSVVAAGALVNKDVPPYTVVAGVPARVVKKLDTNMLK